AGARGHRRHARQPHLRVRRPPGAHERRPHRARRDAGRRDARRPAELKGGPPVMKISKWILPALAVGMVLFSLVHTISAEERAPRAERPLAPAALAPSARRIAGAGMVEPAGESVLVGAHRSGVVAKVLVRVGDEVREGAPLFCLDARAAQADVAVREAEL